MRRDAWTVKEFTERSEHGESAAPPGDAKKISGFAA